MPRQQCDSSLSVPLCGMHTLRIWLPHFELEDACQLLQLLRGTARGAAVYQGRCVHGQVLSAHCCEAGLELLHVPMWASTRGQQLHLQYNSTQQQQLLSCGFQLDFCLSTVGVVPAARLVVIGIP